MRGAFVKRCTLAVGELTNREGLARFLVHRGSIRLLIGADKGVNSLSGPNNGTNMRVGFVYKDGTNIVQRFSENNLYFFGDGVNDVVERGASTAQLNQLWCRTFAPTAETQVAPIGAQTMIGSGTIDFEDIVDSVRIVINQIPPNLSEETGQDIYANFGKLAFQSGGFKAGVQWINWVYSAIHAPKPGYRGFYYSLKPGVVADVVGFQGSGAVDTTFTPGPYSINPYYGRMAF